MARHRCSVRMISPSPSIKFNNERSPHINFSEFDKAESYLLDDLGMAITQFPCIEIFLGHGEKIADIFGPVSSNGLSDEFLEKFGRSVALIGQHLAEKGWLDRSLFIFFDEPTPEWYPIVRDVAELTMKADKRLRPSVYGSNPRPELENYVRDWIGRPDGNLYDHEYRLKRQQMGDRYGTYNHWESFGLNISPVFIRELFWWAWKEKIDFMVLYTIGSWRRERKHAMEYWDMIVYPSSAGPFYESVRWEMIREGLEDYEYLAFLTKILGSDNSNEVIRKLLRDAAYIAGSLYERNLDPIQILSNREKMGEEIARYTKKGLFHEY